MTRVSLGLTDDLADGIIAKQIVELAKTGERHPDVLCEDALKTLREHLFGDYRGSSKRLGSAALQMDQPAQFGAVFGCHSHDPRARLGDRGGGRARGRKQSQAVIVGRVSLEAAPPSACDDHAEAVSILANSRKRL